MPKTQAIDSRRKTEAIDITALCQSMIGATNCGIAVFSILHTTAAIIVCEDEPDLRADVERVAENWLANHRPFRHGRYGAANAEAHITSALAGTSLAIPIANGKLLLGAWQSILLLELDGPRQRKLVCTVVESQD